MQGFLTFLRKTKIIVPDDKTESIVIGGTLYKEGDTIDGFTVLNVLSDRSYTDIYLVRDTMSGGEHVLKLLNRKKTTSDSRYRQEFIGMEQEFRMLQRSKHIPTINKVHDFKISGVNGPYIVLEYIDGKSLSRYMKEHGSTMTHATCLKIIKGIINAFSCLHENNILHGDIHAANILITQKTEVRIIDLGMSREVVMEDNKVIKSGGAYHYMPPERINIPSFHKFSKDADLFSDVYQVGMLIYLVLYNSLPFEGFIWEELAQNILENKVSCAPVSFLNHPIPPLLIRLVKKCLARECLQRYRNGAEILADFKKYAIAENQLAET